MTFKIGDKITIHDGSWSVLIEGCMYNREGVYGTNKITGTVIATDCRLPLGRDSWEANPTPMEGMALHTGVVMYNDLLVQIEDGFVFTSTRHVKLVPVKLKKYLVCVLGVRIEVTKDQYESVKESENGGSDNYFTGTFDEEDWG